MYPFSISPYIHICTQIKLNTHYPSRMYMWSMKEGNPLIIWSETFYCVLWSQPRIHWKSILVLLFLFYLSSFNKNRSRSLNCYTFFTSLYFCFAFTFIPIRYTFQQQQVKKHCSSNKIVQYFMINILQSKYVQFVIFSFRKMAEAAKKKGPALYTHWARPRVRTYEYNYEYGESYYRPQVRYISTTRALSSSSSSVQLDTRRSRLERRRRGPSPPGALSFIERFLEL